MSSVSQYWVLPLEDEAPNAFPRLEDPVQMRLASVSVGEFSAWDCDPLCFRRETPVPRALELVLFGRRLHVNHRVLVHVFLQDHRLQEKHQYLV